MLLNGSVLVHSSVTRRFLEDMIKEKYPNVYVKLNTEKPVMSTVKYVKNKIESKNKKILPDSGEWEK